LVSYILPVNHQPPGTATHIIMSDSNNNPMENSESHKNRMNERKISYSSLPEKTEIPFRSAGGACTGSFAFPRIQQHNYIPKFTRLTDKTKQLMEDDRFPKKKEIGYKKAQGVTEITDGSPILIGEKNQVDCSKKIAWLKQPDSSFEPNSALKALSLQPASLRECNSKKQHEWNDEHNNWNSIVKPIVTLKVDSACVSRNENSTESNDIRDRKEKDTVEQAPLSVAAVSGSNDSSVSKQPKSRVGTDMNEIAYKADKGFLLMSPIEGGSQLCRKGLVNDAISSCVKDCNHGISVVPVHSITDLYNDKNNISVKKERRQHNVGTKECSQDEDSEIEPNDSTGSNCKLNMTNNMEHGGPFSLGLEFGNIGVSRSACFESENSDGSENEVDHGGDLGSTTSAGGVSSITGQSNITHMSELTFSSIHSPKLHLLDYLAGMSTSAYVSSFTAQKSNALNGDGIGLEIRSLSQQSVSGDFLKELLCGKSRNEAVSLAMEIAIEIRKASALLIDSLFEYVQKYSGITVERYSTRNNRQYSIRPLREKQKGLVLPAIAISWLSSQFSTYDKEEQSHKYFYSFPRGKEEKMFVLKELLPKCIQHLRILADPWPPGGHEQEKKRGKSGYRFGNSLVRNSKKRKGRLFLQINKKVKGSPTDFEFQSAVLFLTYYQRLQYFPKIDMQFFPHLRTLELDGVAPESLINLHLTRLSLSTMKLQRGCIFDMSILFSNVDVLSKDSHPETKKSAFLITMPDIHNTLEIKSELSPYYSSGLTRHNVVVTHENCGNGTKAKGKVAHVHANLPALQHLTLSHCGIGELVGLARDERYSIVGTNDSKLKKEPDCAESTNFTHGTSPCFQTPRKGASITTRRKYSNPPLSSIKNLITLDLSHNELIHSATALAGLVTLPKLSLLNLSYNNLLNMNNANMMLGNIKIMSLSGNRLTNVSGLDRMYSLERLDLDMNRISRICDMASLSNLPQLMQLAVKGNPIEQEDPARLRIILLNIFRESRFDFLNKDATYRDLMQTLPKIDSCDVTKKELVALRELTFTQIVPASNCTNNGIVSTDFTVVDSVMIRTRQKDPFKNEDKQEDRSPYFSATNFPSSINAAKTQRKIVKCIHRRIVRIVDTSNEQNRKRSKGKRFKQKKSCVHKSQSISIKGVAGSKRINPHIRNNSRLYMPPFTVEKVIETILPRLKQIYDPLVDDRRIEGCENTNNSADFKESEIVIPCFDFETKKTTDEGAELSAINDSCTIQNSFVSKTTELPTVRRTEIPPVNANKIITSPLTNADLVEQSSTGSSTTENVRNKRFIPNNNKEAVTTAKKGKENATTESLTAIRTERPPVKSIKITDAFPLSKSVLVEQSSVRSSSAADVRDEGCKPNKNKNVNTTANDFILTDKKKLCHTGNSDDNIEIESFKTGRLSTQSATILADDNSFEMTESHSKTSKLTSEVILKHFNFATVEAEAIYDGPDAYADLLVAGYYELYFRSYVFPLSPPEDSSCLYQSPDAFHKMELPRIQLYQTDRDLMMWTIAQNEKRTSVHFSQKEKLVAVSLEDVLPCGLAATARIVPNKKPLRRFHGEIVHVTGMPVNMVDSQKLIFCISNFAVYFIPDCGGFSSTSSVRRAFPSSICNNARFKDALWPHSFCRHPLKFLRGITIGFCFQRLAMHFQLPHLRDEVYVQSEGDEMMSTYTYVLFTCNKRHTIKILQNLQSSVKENSSSNGTEPLHETLRIDNDDRAVLDAVGAALAATFFSGVILHYQILYQTWMHGNREAVRRAFVLTDHQILLFDENYTGDSNATTFQYDSRNNENTGNVALKMVKNSDLIDVFEISPAIEDPRIVTLGIKAPGRFRRSHHWRLICRDGENAESLVEDVRKATTKCNTKG